MNLRRARRFGCSFDVVPGIILAEFVAGKRPAAKIVFQIVSNRFKVSHRR